MSTFAQPTTMHGHPAVTFGPVTEPCGSTPTLPDSIVAAVSDVGLSAGALAAVRRTAERVVDVGEAAKAAAMQTDDLIASLKEADGEISSFDAIYDQEVLLELLRRESDPPPAFKTLTKIRRQKEAAIEAADFELAAELREFEREVVRAHEPAFCEDAIWRLRRNGLVKTTSQPAQAKLTRAGRRLAASLL